MSVGAPRCGSRGVERANTTPPSGLAEEASARWCRTRRLSLSLPASSIKPCPASALPPAPPHANHFRACATPFQGAQSPAVCADHEKLGHPRPRLGSARSVEAGAEKLARTSWWVYGAGRLHGTSCGKARRGRMWDEDASGSAVKSRGRAKKGTPPLLSFRPHPTPYYPRR